MAALLVLAIVLPLVLLIVGVLFGVAAARWWSGRRCVELATAAGATDVELAAESALPSVLLTTALPSSMTAATASLPPGRKDSHIGLPRIHIVASSGVSGDMLLRPPSASPPLAHRLARPPALRTPDPMLPDFDGAYGNSADPAAAAGGVWDVGGRGSDSTSPLAGLAHRKTMSLDLGQLVRAGPGVINQVMDDWEARSTLYRIMSMDAGKSSAASPQQHAAAAAAASLLSPTAAVLFSPVTAGGGAGGDGSRGGIGGAMPKGEVHMDEIDLIECIGKGGYGCVYKASWRGAGVAVKYIVCPTDDVDGLGRAIREVVVSRKMSHPNVVQCYSWTVLTENEGQAWCSPSSPTADQQQGTGRQRFVGRLASVGGAAGGRLRGLGFDTLHHSGVRRGLDLRFKTAAVAAAGAAGSNSPCASRSPSCPPLQRISEQLVHESQEAEGGAQDGGEPAEAICSAPMPAFEQPLSSSPPSAAAAKPVEAAVAAGLGPEAALALGGGERLFGHLASAVALPRPTVDSVVEELVAEAAAELGQARQQREWEQWLASGGSGSPASYLPRIQADGEIEQEQEERSTSASPASLQESPEAPVAAVVGGGKPLLKLALQPANSISPNGSPGIQAVHPQQPVVEAEEIVEARPDEAVGTEEERQEMAVTSSELPAMPPARDTLPASPFAAPAAQAAPHRQSCSGAGAWAAQSQLALGGVVDGVAGVPPKQQQVQQPQHAQQPKQQRSTTDSSEVSDGAAGEDVYARFSSYEEMVAHFRALAAAGQPATDAALQREQQEQLVALGLQLPASVARLGVGGALGRSGASGGLQGNDYNLTAASSFSDVLTPGAFMLEGSASGLELSMHSSQPSSPRHLLHQRSCQASWLPPSSASSSRPLSPRSHATAAAAGFRQLPRAATWAAAPAHQGQRQRRQEQRQVGGSLRDGLPAGLSAGLPLTLALPLPKWGRQQDTPASGGQTEQGSNELSASVPRSEGGVETEQLAERQFSSESIEPRPEALAADAPDAATAAAAAEPEGEEQLVAAAEEGQQVMGEEDCGAPTVQHGHDTPAAMQLSDAVGAAPPLVSVYCSSAVSLSVWQNGQGVAAAVAGSRGNSGSELHRQPQACSSSGQTASSAQNLRPPPLSRLSSVGGPSGSVTPRGPSLSSLAALAGSAAATAGGESPSLAITPRQQSTRSGRGTPSGVLRVEELRAEAALGGGSGGGEGSSTECLSVGSHNDSFNSEEGFGSPVKQRRGGVQDVFLLEELALSGSEALMVVVMEYCDLGSLRKALKRRAFRPSAKWPFQTTYRALLRTAQEIAKGMGYIHEFNIVHSDLKPGNVLLKTHKVDRRGYIAKVSDFGLSRTLDAEDTHDSLDTTLGTIAYTAPETFAHNFVKKPSDVYAFGIMLWEMFYCRDPYEGLMDGQICVGVTDGSLRPEFEADCPEPYRHLAERCWHQDPEQRPSFEEVDAELVRIEMEFRLACHRTATASKRTSTASQAGGSAYPSRPGSPKVQPRAGSYAQLASRQMQAAAFAD